MSFDSINYLLFFPAVWLTYLLLNHKWQNVLLLASSYLFYGTWDVRFLFLIILSTAVDYCCGLIIGNNSIKTKHYLYASTMLVASVALFVVTPAWQEAGYQLNGMPDVVGWIVGAVVAAVLLMPLLYKYVKDWEHARKRRTFLLLSVFTNLGILGFFKYFDFFISGAEQVFMSLGVTNVELLHLDIVLPVGISFYTFQTLSYSIGIYRGELKPTKDIISFSLFVAFFPQLVAGPIERASHLLPLITSERRVSLDWIKSGLFLILLGLFKKIGVSNGLAASVDSIYNTSAYVSSADVALATLCFAFQIYCDFSGYSDIARGSAKMFGIRLMRNFEQPYFSKNPSEFWRRWHISLSSWLRDYLYISMGGNRKGNTKTYRNLMLTMALGGLWHGAAMNFIFWGVYQGALLCVHRYLTNTGRFFSRLSNKYINILYIGLFFLFTLYGWLLFRVTSLDQIVSLTSALGNFDFSVTLKRPTFSALLGLPLLLLIDLYQNKTGYTNPWRFSASYVQGGLYAVLLFILAMGLSNAPTQFIYFQF